MVVIIQQFQLKLLKTLPPFAKFVNIQTRYLTVRHQVQKPILLRCIRFRCKKVADTQAAAQSINQSPDRLHIDRFQINILLLYVSSRMFVRIANAQGEGCYGFVFLSCTYVYLQDLIQSIRPTCLLFLSPQEYQFSHYAQGIIIFR